jgi:hypothetical protein
MYGEDHNTLEHYAESPRIKLLRSDNSAGITPPHRPTGRFFFSALHSHLNRANPSPLRNTVLSSNLPLDVQGRNDSGNERGREEKLATKKAVSFGETIQVFEIDPESAADEQPWAHYPRQVKCKDWDGRSEEYEKPRSLREGDEGEEECVRQ